MIGKKYKLSNQDGGVNSVLFPVIGNMQQSVPMMQVTPTVRPTIAVPVPLGAVSVVRTNVDPGEFTPTQNNTSKEIKNINIEKKQAELQQGIIGIQTQLPPAPGLMRHIGYNPVYANPPIILNPNESKPRLEISSPESDDVLVISSNKKDSKEAENDINTIKTQLDNLNKPDPSGNIINDPSGNILKFEDLLNEGKIKNIFNGITDLSYQKKTRPNYLRLLGLPFGNIAMMANAIVPIPLQQPKIVGSIF
jgi:hypothetical protein